MHRTYVRRRLVAAALALVIIAMAAPAAARAFVGPRAQTPSVTYVVRPGDTLWSIAERTSRGADPRAVVDAILAANHLQGVTIQPGQALVVPSV